MIRILKYLGFIIMALLAIYLIFCFLGKAKMDYVVSKNINASPEKIFAQIGDMKNNGNWSPWQNKDATMKLTYGTTTTGIDGSFCWESKKMGSGCQSFIEYIPNQKVTSKINFKDWNSTAISSIILTPNGNSTKVDWTYTDANNIPFFMRGMMKIINMEDKVKADYLEGLNNLENYLQKNP